MKRLLCLLLTGLMLFSAAACTAKAPNTQTEALTEAQGDLADTPSDPVDALEPETPEQDGGNVPLTPIEDPPIQPGEPIDNPPIEITDPIQPIYETDGTTTEVGGYADFANLLSASLLSGTQNRNLSPISVYLALALLTEGANGETQAELLALLGCKTVEELRGVCGAMLNDLSVGTESSTLELHDSLWMADSIAGHPVSFVPDYLDTLAEVYRSEANVVEFGTESAARQIADWINRNTRGKINVQPEALQFDPSTVAVLINTIYLKDRWSDQFAPEATRPGTFAGLDGDIDVSYMHRVDGNRTVRFGDGWMAYRVYLAGVGWVTFVLPDEGIALEKLLGSPEAIDKLLHAGIERNYDVDLLIPKFRFKDKMELTEVLRALGLDVAFSDAADYSGMTDAACKVDKVIQESYIGMDENGVEAAAYTMIEMRTTAFMPVELEKIDFHLDRPFFYAIESYDGTVLFIGTVTTPVDGE